MKKHHTHKLDPQNTTNKYKVFSCNVLDFHVTPRSARKSHIGPWFWVSPENTCDGPENGPEMVQKSRKSFSHNILPFRVMFQYAPVTSAEALLKARRDRHAKLTFTTVANGQR